MKQLIYADCAATTPVAPEVLDAMFPWFRDSYGNPSSLHQLGRHSRTAIQTARQQVAQMIGAIPEQVFFTSGGTESNNWAIKNCCRSSLQSNRHVITTAIEHHAVLHTVGALEMEGVRSTVVPVASNGIVDPEYIKKAITPDTVLVSVMYANNEIGTIQPIREIGEICREHDILFHVDAVQAVGKIPIDVVRDNIDLLSLSGHKLGGPKGIGALFISDQAKDIGSYIHGGGQEREMRSGTENVPGIVGLGAAMELAATSMDCKSAKVTAMRDALIDGIITIPGSRLNGDRTARLPGNANFSFVGVESDKLLTVLELGEGVLASSGSACTSTSLEQSHVLQAIGVPEAHGSIRLTIDSNTTPDDIQNLCEAVKRTVSILRSRW